jgi:hypothetical protein
MLTTATVTSISIRICLIPVLFIMLIKLNY